MPSISDVQPGAPTATDRRIAYLAALAIAIHLAEAALPSVLPGIKPGLANIITVVVLCLLGWRAAAWVSLLRVLVGSMLIGAFLSPTFFLSLSGALSALLALGLASRLPGIGPMGLSLCAGLAHMSGQFAMAYALFLPHPGLWALFPAFMTVALIFSALNGIIAQQVLKRLRTRDIH